MLEVKNLSKIYKTKGGDVKALDNVSVTFPEKGMIFLLGKSGSGKSTLLNICGGLDSPTSGEIIVKGKSSKNFLQSDFDSYRNTFIGFIFQEYNILNEFSVEDNIALALELQGKPKNKKIINELLKKVELVGYNKRKPNTLSGGQKQRIAIARALVKSPEIIMADEPTGALDSNTGKQVFDTLKNLSKEKLVLVVSHDRDFAEQYADRIIELKDGQIISDVSKSEEHQKYISANVNKIGKTLCISNGKDLTENDFIQIKEFLRNTQGDVVIASDEKEVKEFKSISRISENGTKEVFVNTNENEIVKKRYSPSESAFISSKLPGRHAFKLGVSGLKTKPIRLFFTILLCTIAFSLFALSSTMILYDKSATLKNSLSMYDSDVVMLKKEYQVSVIYNDGNKEHDPYIENRDTLFTQNELNSIKSSLSGEATIVKGLEYGSSIGNLNSSAYSNYYSTTITNAVYLDENNSFRNKIAGTYPTNDNEIVISSYIADSIIYFGLKDRDGNKINLNSSYDLIGKKIYFNFGYWTITGIYETPVIDSKFDVLKDGQSDYDLQNEFMGVLSSNLYTTAIIGKADFDKIKDGNAPTSYDYFNDDNKLDIESANLYSAGVYFNSIDAVRTYEGYYFDDNKTTLSNNQILLSINTFSSVLSNKVTNCINELKNSSKNAEATELENDYNAIQEKISCLEIGCKSVVVGGSYEYQPLTDAETEQYFNDVKAFVNRVKVLTNSDITISLCVNMPSGDSIAKKTFAVSGFFIHVNNDDACYFSPDDYSTYRNAIIEREKENGRTSYTKETTKYKESKDAKYSTILIKFDSSSSVQVNELVKMLNTINQDDSIIVLDGPIMMGIEMVDNLVSILSPVFLIAGIVLAVFASLLVCNFISVSISYKKKDIGILRAVGAKSTDVFKIFFSESIVIVLLCIACSIAASIVVCNILNAQFAAMLSGVAIFVFGPINIIILIALALVSTFLATFFPVNSAAKKKPVESIRAL